MASLTFLHRISAFPPHNLSPLPWIVITHLHLTFFHVTFLCVLVSSASFSAGSSSGQGYSEFCSLQSPRSLEGQSHYASTQLILAERIRSTNTREIIGNDMTLKMPMKWFIWSHMKWSEDLQVTQLESLCFLLFLFMGRGESFRVHVVLRLLGGHTWTHPGM